MTLDERVKQRIEELKKEREQFVANANAQIGAFNATIQELEKLLDSVQEEPEGG